MIPMRPVAWLVNLALAGTVSYGTAAVSMQVLEQRLEQGAPVTASVGQAPEEQAAREPLPLTAFQPVLDANIFGARRSEVKSAREAGPQPPGQAAPAPAAPLELTLTGTVIMGERSFAMVADASGRNEQVYRLWDCLPAGENHPTRTCDVDQGKLVSVRRKKIAVEYRGERLTFEITDKPAPRVAAVPVRAQPRVGRAPVQQVPANVDDASNAPFPITQEGNVMEVRVPSDEVSKAFENFSEVLKQARVVPYTDETGQGFQIRNIRPGSIFARIGLNNFDKIKAVNGEPITTADQALRLLTMFRNEKEILLDLERRNEDVQLNYIIE